ncbi:hypothetical protein ACNPMX_11770 [Stenotrophomonas maltophilia]
MSSEITRFNHVTDWGMERDARGDYVLYSDHEAEVARLRAEVEAYRKDAKRWRFFQTAGYNVTLRMHYTRPDEREKAIDAAMGESA